MSRSFYWLALTALTTSCILDSVNGEVVSMTASCDPDHPEATCTAMQSSDELGSTSSALLQVSGKMSGDQNRSMAEQLRDENTRLRAELAQVNEEIAQAQKEYDELSTAMQEEEKDSEDADSEGRRRRRRRKKKKKGGVPKGAVNKFMTHLNGALDEIDASVAKVSSAAGGAKSSVGSVSGKLNSVVQYTKYVHDYIKQHQRRG
eukprot:gnl/TRDRNA2_/TRDRNA2_84139_c0_seq1.p1 gnl/TRDRNA2_/TRDRNA2_84139_c0~~gnl/TRDRNA2_/TRDRNA2_84139_c0_seq1.p1  ORF type:complete len:204 (+),score=55.41 gnl/TRDRNA2_/TRDRNA2_84139_c0_seq1:105-716(+)